MLNTSELNESLASLYDPEYLSDIGKITLFFQYEHKKIKVKVRPDTTKIDDFLIEVEQKFNILPGWNKIMYKGQRIPTNKLIKELYIRDHATIEILSKTVEDSHQDFPAMQFHDFQT